jgi:hypothetical protein
VISCRSERAIIWFAPIISQAHNTFTTATAVLLTTLCS